MRINTRRGKSVAVPENYIETCYAGWLGKVIGVQYGAPVEGWTYARIREAYGELDGYVKDYKNFASDDDICGPMFFLRGLEDDPGLRMTYENMGNAWLNYLSVGHGVLWWGGYGVSTEHTAYLNLLSGIPAPESGSEAHNGKAMSEQIGGQIFSDCWGLIWPGNPQKAAEYAEIAARVSHDGEAVNGSRFVAGAISAAFTENNVVKVLEKALSLIPSDSEYYRAVTDMFRFHEEVPGDWRRAMEYVMKVWGYDRYPGACHVIPNSAVMVLSMLYGEGDFTRTLNICNMCGWDTDCNCGNVGTIMGILCGLDGIEQKFRKPVNDFVVTSSVIGSMNISTLPDYVRRLSRIAYRLQKEEIPEAYRDFVNGKYTFDFRLPGSTCAFRLGGEGQICEDVMEQTSGVYCEQEGSLCVRFRHMGKGERRRVWYGTYYHPEDFSDSRYDPAFSPVIYPGQEFSMLVKAEEDMDACLYYQDDHGKTDVFGKISRLSHGEWTLLTLKIPGGTDLLISQVGICVSKDKEDSKETLLYIDHVDFSGKADYSIDFSKEKTERWQVTFHWEVTQLTRRKGLWETEDGMLSGACDDFGEAFTGNPEWKDAEITVSWHPVGTRGRTGFGFRIQGGIRGYAVLCDQEKLYLCRKNRGYEEIASCKRPCGESLELTVRCIGDSMEISSKGQVVLRTEDAEFRHGMLAFIVTDGARALYEQASVREL